MIALWFYNRPITKFVGRIHRSIDAAGVVTRVDYQGFKGLSRGPPLPMVNHVPPAKDEHGAAVHNGKRACGEPQRSIWGTLAVRYVAVKLTLIMKRQAMAHPECQTIDYSTERSSIVTVGESQIVKSNLLKG